MDKLQLIAGLLMLLASLPLMAVFVGYPLFLWLRPSRRAATPLSVNEPVNESANEPTLPTVTLLLSVRNGERLIDDKLDNMLALDYPPQLLDFIVFNDGSSDRTLERLQARHQSRLTILSSRQHLGKAAALNQAVNHTHAGVLVFTDLDALLNPGAIRLLANRLRDPAVGGVCGQRIIAGRHLALKRPQQQYIDFDSWIKAQESKHGYLTSNDGKLYALRQVCFKPIAEGVTDDLYSALNIIAQGKHFVFEPRATATIATPARNPQHEISRRRRITCRSLSGIYRQRALFNPRHHGAYGIALLINKLLRRSFWLSLLLLLCGNALLLTSHWLWTLTFAGQLSLYGLTAVAMGGNIQLLPKALSRYSDALVYFVLGNIGMMLGTLDFFAHRKVVKWEPKKND